MKKVIVVILILALGVCFVGCGAQNNKSDRHPAQLGGEVREVEPVETTVYITRAGEKYHLSDCKHLRRSKIKVSLKEAKIKDYEACKDCKPYK